MRKKIDEIVKFISNDIWIHSRDELGTFKKIVLKELQIIILETKVFFRKSTLSKASALAFSSLLSLIPVLAIIFLFFKMFGGGLVEKEIKPMIYKFLTAGNGDKLSSYLDSFLNSATVETLGTIGFVFLFISVYSILSSIEHTFNDIWGVKKDRNPLDQLKTYLSILFVTPVLVTLSIWFASKLMMVATIGDNLYSGFSAFLIAWFLPFVFTMILFWIIIKIMPNCIISTKYALFGAISGTVLFYISKYAFVYYAKKAVNYNLIYGSIAALPIFMLWIFFFWVIVLLSVEITYVRQNFQNLKYEEIGIELNRKDKLKAFMSILYQIINPYIAQKEIPSPEKIGDLTGLNNILIEEIIDDLKNSNLIVETTDKKKILLPAIPLGDFTLKKVIDSADKMYMKSFLSFNKDAKMDLLYSKIDFDDSTVYCKTIKEIFSEI